MHAAAHCSTGTSLALIALLVLAPRVHAQSKKNEPQRAQRLSVLVVPIADADRTQIMVLGTPHLSSLGNSFQAKSLDGLLDVLATFKPDVIAVENMPSEVIAGMLIREKTHAPIAQQFAAERIELGKTAQEKLSLTWEEAWTKSEATLGKMAGDETKAPTAKDRLDLIQHLVAAYELDSAALHWSLLAEANRASNDVISIPLANRLDARLVAQNEISSVALRLGKRLELSRIDYIDDFQIGPKLMQIAPQLMKEMADEPAYQAVGQSPFYADMKKRQSEAAASGDLLSHYRYLNSTDYGSRDVDTQWGVFFRTKLPSGLDRTRAAFWEVRNLNMVSHIRSTAARIPGGRMLVIVGVGHKPFFDQYLRQMMDVSVVQLSEYLPKEDHESK